MYRFFVESLGIYTNTDLVKQSCTYVLSKISSIRSHIDNIGEFDGSLLSKEESNMNDINQKSQEDYIPQYCKFYKDDDFIVFVLFQDDYTIGKLVEKYFYNFHQKKCSFVGFKKEHPTKKEAYIYIKYNKSSNESSLYDDFKLTLDNISKMFENIRESV
jgi:DNA-directed RNA polymerase subunit L